MNELQLCVSGWFLIEAIRIDVDGNEISLRIAANWFPNLITDNGLNMLAENLNPFYAAQVGSGSTPPNVLDTSLVARIAGSSTAQSTATGAQSSPPYYGWSRRTIRFPVGAAAGNLAEIGMSSTATGALFSRSLILDANGDPTTIVIQPDEVLDVTYELRTYPPTVDTQFTVDISGVNHECVVRAANITNAGYWSYPASQSNNFYMSAGFTAYNGGLGSITSTPTGNNSSLSSNDMTVSQYITGSHYLDVTASAELNNWNLTSGISVVVARTKLGAFQISYSPAIQKTAETILSLPIRISWARYTP